MTTHRSISTTATAHVAAGNLCGFCERTAVECHAYRQKEHAQKARAEDRSWSWEIVHCPAGPSPRYKTKTIRREFGCAMAGRVKSSSQSGCRAAHRCKHHHASEPRAGGSINRDDPGARC